MYRVCYLELALSPGPPSYSILHTEKLGGPGDNTRLTWSFNYVSGCNKEVAALHSDHYTQVTLQIQSNL